MGAFAELGVGQMSKISNRVYSIGKEFSPWEAIKCFLTIIPFLKGVGVKRIEQEVARFVFFVKNGGKNY